MGKYLFLDGGVYESTDKLVGHNFFLVTGFSLASVEGTFNSKIADGCLTLQSGSEGAARFIIVLTHSQDCHHIYKVILGSYCHSLHGFQQFGLAVFTDLLSSGEQHAQSWSIAA